MHSMLFISVLLYVGCSVLFAFDLKFLVDKIDIKIEYILNYLVDLISVLMMF